MISSRFVCFILLTLASLKSYGFPEMIVHGYVNCTTCHVSPTGGGVLTEYGRSLSRELLSVPQGLSSPTADVPEQEKKWFVPGGDVRVIQTYVDTPQVKRGEFFLMQADFMPAFFWKQWSLVASLGIRGGPNDVEDRNNLFSRIHYLMYQVADAVSIRVGRFMPQYGLNEPNHTVVTRQGLGFGEQTETDNIEAAYLTDQWDFFATGILGRIDEPDSNYQKGVALSGAYNFWEKNKLGVNAFHGKSDTTDRWLVGVWGIFSLSKEMFLMSELDHQWSTSSRSPDITKRGIASYQRLGYQLTQGVQIYATHQLAYLDFDSVLSRRDAFGPGVDYFPREHFEIRAEFLKQRRMSQGGDYTDFAWVLAHYYF